MRHWLATPADQQRRDWLKRFDARFWTVDFPRPMMAAATTPAPQTLRVDLSFLAGNDLAGLIWESADRFDHPLLGYETNRDYRGVRLGFRWQSTGLMPLDAVNGPTLTIEGRDAAGNPRGWYVRLWNYAVGTPTDALITLDFDALDGGFLLPGEADPVFAGDIDRLFISLVPPGYTGVEGPLPTAVDAAVTLSGIVCDGPSSTLAIGDTVVPPHDLRIATGYEPDPGAAGPGHRGARLHDVDQPLCRDEPLLPAWLERGDGTVRGRPDAAAQRPRGGMAPRLRRRRCRAWPDPDRVAVVRAARPACARCVEAA